MSISVAGFKAYDIRGLIPDELNMETAEAIGKAYATYLSPRKVVVGHDIRLSSPGICGALSDGLRSQGVDVARLGVCGTEEVYFATDHYGFDGGIVVTASHNPKDYNGMKLVRDGSRPISGDSGLLEIRDLVAQNSFDNVASPGNLSELDHHAAYIAKLLSYVDVAGLKPLTIVVNPGNGCAGDVIDRLAEFLPVNFVRVHFEADGNFPNGVPNPLLPENRAPTIDAIRASGADLGLAWDGDFDRCFFFDETGRFIEGYYIVGLLAQAFLQKNGGGTIVHDPRLTWNTIDVVDAWHGRAVMSKPGHAFIKERMREEDAIYGGEMSAHHYFRDFAYCDSGMVPWLLVIDLLSRDEKKFSELVDERMTMYPVSGEINRRIDDTDKVMASIEKTYAATALRVERVDGLSMEFDRWRFNVRSSNTEPVVRLNVESKADHDLMVEKTDELLALMGGDVL